MNREVTCINKRDRTNPHERIQAIGGAGWKHQEDAAIRAIRGGTEGYYVSQGGRTVRVVTAVHQGREYLKIEPDGYSPDNLLALSECR